MRFSWVPSTIQRYSMFSVGAGSKVTDHVPSPLSVAIGPPLASQPQNGPVKRTESAAAPHKSTVATNTEGAKTHASQLLKHTTSRVSATPERTWRRLEPPTPLFTPQPPAMKSAVSSPVGSIKLSAVTVKPLLNLYWNEAGPSTFTVAVQMLSPSSSFMAMAPSCHAGSVKDPIKYMPSAETAICDASTWKVMSAASGYTSHTSAH